MNQTDQAVTNPDLGEYRLATGESIRELHAEVAICIALGFMPQGGVALAAREYYRDGYKKNGVLYVQAMWKPIIPSMGCGKSEGVGS